MYRSNLLSEITLKVKLSIKTFFFNINNTINRTVNIKNVNAHIIVKYVHLYTN